MRVVVGSLVKDRAWVLHRWFEAIYNQPVDVEVACLVTPSDDDSEMICRVNGAHVALDHHPGRPIHEIDLHAWGDPRTYEYMARLRNRLLSLVMGLGADVFVSLDTDVLLPPDSLSWLLERLEERSGILSPAVNMGRGATAWNTMWWADAVSWAPSRDLTEVPPPPAQLGQVDVVMAAILMDRKGMRAQWHAHSHGEDIGLCADAEKLGIDRWWAPEVVCEHVMMRH